jgi:hypothetical protein
MNGKIKAPSRCMRIGNFLGIPGAFHEKRNAPRLQMPQRQTAKDRQGRQGARRNGLRSEGRGSFDPFNQNIGLHTHLAGSFAQKNGFAFVGLHQNHAAIRAGLMENGGNDKTGKSPARPEIDPPCGLRVDVSDNLGRIANVPLPEIRQSTTCNKVERPVPARNHVNQRTQTIHCFT